MDNQKLGNKTTYTLNTKEKQKKTALTNKTNNSLVFYATKAEVSFNFKPISTSKKTQTRQIVAAYIVLRRHVAYMTYLFSHHA